jgi:hypothetical protein
MSKIELKLKPFFEETMTVELTDLGFTKEEWNSTPESAKERILDEYLSTYQPEKENFWSWCEWTPKY